MKAHQNLHSVLKSALVRARSVVCLSGKPWRKLPKMSGMPEVGALILSQFGDRQDISHVSGGDIHQHLMNELQPLLIGMLAWPAAEAEEFGGSGSSRSATEVGVRNTTEGVP